jgi:hypothetical protein
MSLMGADGILAREMPERMAVDAKVLCGSGTAGLWG